MSAMSRSTSSLPQSVLPNDTVKVLSALWGLRFALNHESGPAHISDMTGFNNAWLTIVGDCVVWPQDVLDEFIRLSTEETTEISPRRSRRKKSNSAVKWSLVFRHFADVYSKQPERLNKQFQKSILILEARWLNIREQDMVWHNINLLGELLQLTELDRLILVFLIILDCSRPLKDFFMNIDYISIAKAAEMLACLLNSTPSLIMDALHQKGLLMANGLISKGRIYPEWHDFIQLSEPVKSALTYPNKTLAELMQHFTDEASPGHLGVDDIPHLENSLQLLTKVMTNGLLKQERGINILLYGAPGTGKTEFAKLLAQQVGAILYEVSCKDSEGEAACSRDRYVSLLMAQKFLSSREDTLLLFDEVEDVLAGSGSSGRYEIYAGNQQNNRFSKAWINQQLEHNPVPTIWICNDHNFIDPAHLRRFLFHLEFQVPPRSVRQRVAERYFAELAVSDLMIKQLSQYADLSPAQLENIARLLKLNGGHDPAQAECLVETALRNNMKVMGQSLDKQSIKPITPFRLDYLNVDSQVPMPRIVEALKKRPQATLCFYGPPGTGKTQLAGYLAEQLDQNLMVKRASDLMSKWVGESEKNIATMFEEARSEQAILFLDEADSFLRDRQGMTKSWEVSEVNELLQQIEHFNGIFICATNLFDQLDQAALRRFTFKIRFDYLKPCQRLNLFAESLQLKPETVSPEQQSRLQKLDQLTPGEFATVLRQARTLNEMPTVNEFLHQLETECILKNNGRSQRSIGFV